MHRVRVTPGVLDLFRARRVFLQRPNDPSPPPTWIGFELNCALEAYSHALNGPWLAYRMGAFSYAHSQVSPFVMVGRYCSISSEVSWIAEDHPIDWVTSYPLTYDQEPMPGLRAFWEDQAAHPEREIFKDAGIRPTRLEHDVWIGQRAAIMSGVKIGTGAVVAAGALVVKDVDPYTIVGGVPAKPIRKRFPEGIIQRLLASEWWKYSPKDFAPLRMADPASFLDQFEVLKPTLQPMVLQGLTGQEIISAAAS